MGVLLLDHQDSFTYNLAELITEVSSLPLTIVSSSEWHPNLLDGKMGVILSPGPMRPKDHPGLFPCIAACANRNVPLLGVCLGHQGIGEYFGGSLTRLPQVIHGRKKTIQIQPSSPLFAGIPQAMEVGLYHSWMLEKESVPEELDIIGVSAENEIMAVEHREKPIFGIQFHPESFLSPTGAQLMRNFIRLCS